VRISEGPLMFSPSFFGSISGRMIGLFSSRSTCIRSILSQRERRARHHVVYAGREVPSIPAARRLLDRFGYSLI
jgi:hypothetical protein